MKSSASAAYNTNKLRFSSLKGKVDKMWLHSERPRAVTSMKTFMTFAVSVKKGHVIKYYIIILTLALGGCLFCHIFVNTCVC